jgi:hypothetical protein
MSDGVQRPTGGGASTLLSATVRGDEGVPLPTVPYSIVLSSAPMSLDDPKQRSLVLDRGVCTRSPYENSLPPRHFV